MSTRQERMDRKRAECSHPKSELRDVAQQPDKKYCPACYEVIPGVNMRK